MTSILISDFRAAFENVKESYNLSNDSFPTLVNAYVKRGKVRRKPGSTLLSRLQRDLSNQALDNTDGSGNFSDNIKTLLGLESNSVIKPGTISVTVDAQAFTEPATPDGTLTNGTGGTGTINYSTGALTLDTNPNLPNTPVFISFSYYPCLPVMGLEEYAQPGTFPIYVQMDTKYSYQIDQSTNTFYDTTFYAQSGNAFTFTGADYQQFMSVTANDAMFVTNGKAGFHVKNIGSIQTFGATATVTINNHGLQTGDYVFFNEINDATIGALNGQTLMVTVTGVNTFTVPTTIAVAGPIASGIVQYLTQSAANNIDGIRYYLGDPIASSTKGWVNFAPPLSEYNASTNTSPEYLIGADIVFVFKDRLLFAGVTTATSQATGGVYRQNRVIYSQNGTPFYANNAALLPPNQGAEIEAWYQNVPARGGFINAPVDQQIISVNNQQDVMIFGLTSSTWRFIFTQDDSFPFIFQNIASDFGSGHTFGSVSLENNVVFVGSYGFAQVTQNQMGRIDLQIPDELFQISYNNNDQKRLCAIRDFRNEWIYFTAPVKQDTPPATFPSSTYLYNYRENNWAILKENYTHYGRFTKTTNFTWATLPYRTWTEWTTPWNFGGNDERFPNVIGGNQQGFVLIKANRETEDFSNYISAISGNLVTSPNHNMQEGDYILIQNAIGTNVDEINGTIQQVRSPTQNDFLIDTTYSGVYNGNAIFKRIPNFDIRTKTFSPFWQMGRKTRNEPIRFLIDNAGENGQVTINLYTNQISDFASNSGPPNPQTSPPTQNNTPYSSVLYTSPEPLQQNPQRYQSLIWHRLNQVVIGDSIQIGFTLSDTQMRNQEIAEAAFNLNAIYMTLRQAGVL